MSAQNNFLKTLTAAQIAFHCMQTKHARGKERGECAGPACLFRGPKNNCLSISLAPAGGTFVLHQTVALSGLGPFHFSLCLPQAWCIVNAVEGASGLNTLVWLLEGPSLHLGTGNCQAKCRAEAARPYWLSACPWPGLSDTLLLPVGPAQQPGSRLCLFSCPVSVSPLE